MKTFKEFLETRLSNHLPWGGDPSDYDHASDMHGDRSWRRDDIGSPYDPSKPIKTSAPTKDRKQLTQEIIRMISTKGRTELEKIHAFISNH